MDDISIDFLEELGEYNSEIADRMKTSGVDPMREEINIYARKRTEEDPDSMDEWRRMLAHITQAKQKIGELNKEIRTRVSAFGISHEEYDTIIADTDMQKQDTHLKRLLGERMAGIHGILLASGNFDKQVHRLNSVEEMLTMRKDVYIDQKNIIEALSVMLLDDAHAKQIIRSILDETSEPSHTDSGNQSNQSIRVLFEECLKEMLRILSLIEQYEHDGLSRIRRLEEFDRQIVYMLTAIALKKHT